MAEISFLSLAIELYSPTLVPLLKLTQPFFDDSRPRSL